MINTIVWCMMMVYTQDKEEVDTAVRGRVLDVKYQENNKMYVVDFSEYVKKQGYQDSPSYKHWMIPDYLCTKE